MEVSERSLQTARSQKHRETSSWESASGLQVSQIILQWGNKFSTIKLKAQYDFDFWKAQL